jgi:hypothetical protein
LTILKILSYFLEPCQGSVHSRQDIFIVYSETVLLPFNKEKIKIVKTKVSMRLGWDYVRI